MVQVTQRVRKADTLAYLSSNEDILLLLLFLPLDLILRPLDKYSSINLFQKGILNSADFHSFK